MKLIFRKAVPADALAIVDFQISMARETEGIDLDRDRVTRGVEAVFRRPELGTYYVAADGDRVAGGLLVTFEWSDWRNLTVWWIQSVYVRPEYRRQHVYGGLYTHIRVLAEQDRDVGGIRLYVDRRNSIAQGVYTRLGMNGEHYLVYEWMKSF